MRLPFALLAACTLAAPAMAQDDGGTDGSSIPDVTRDLPLEGDSLKALFQDKTHRGYYEYLSKPDGEFAFTERMNADGTTLHTRDGEDSVGRWAAMSNVVCFRYADMNGGCFNMYQQGNCFYAFSVESQQFIAVMVYDGETPDCEPPLV